MSTNQTDDSQRGEVSYDELVASYQKRIYFFIRSMIFNVDDAYDVLQEVNIILYKKQNYYVSGTNFKAWAFAIARYEGLNYLKKRKKVEYVELSEPILNELANKAEERVDEVDDYSVALAGCMQELPEDAYELIQSRYASRTPLEDVAGRMGTTVGALKQKLFRVRNRLKKCIQNKIKISKKDEFKS